MSQIEKVNALQPKLRFVGFNETWDKKSLNDVTYVYDGTHQTPQYTNSGVMFLSAENIKTLQSKKFISKQSFDKDFKVHPQMGDVLMTRIGDVGTANVIETNEPRAYYVTLALFKQKVLDPYFLKASITAPFVQKDIWFRTLHIAFPKKINMNEICRVVINTPKTKEEQTKIGNFFQNLDKQLKLHQDKLAKLQQLKKAMLGKMFPKVGATVPEIRFAGFSDKWWHTSLGLAVNIIMGQSPNGINYTSNPEDHILVQGNADLRNGYVYPRSWTTQVTKRAFKGYLIFSVRAPVGDIGKTEYDVVLGRGVAALRANEFIFHQLKKLQLDNYWSKVSSGSTFDAISSTELAKTQIWMTNSKEQTKIGEYFQNLDLLITLQQQQINKLKNIKQACLDKMFV